MFRTAEKALGHRPYLALRHRLGWLGAPPRVITDTIEIMTL